jgi:hypothetical protein
MIRFNWRRIHSDDYEMLKQWWSDNRWPSPPPIHHLSNIGVLVYDEETKTPLYSAFLYDMGVSSFLVEYTVSNKNAPIEMKRGALEYLMNVMSVIAKNMGASTLLTSTNNSGFIQSLKKASFMVGDTGVTHLIKIL